MSSSAMPAASGSACDPWKFWATCGWTAVILIGWGIAQLVVVVGLLLYTGAWSELTAADASKLSSDALVLSSVSILSGIVEVGIVALAVRFARCRFADYLGFVWPSRTWLWIGVACLIVLLPLADVSSWLTGRDIVPPFVIETYRSAQEAGVVWLFAITLVVAAPLAEEIVFRGFMFRGLAASPVGIAGALLIPSAVWAAMHVQYETFFIVQIFLLGMVFGVLRWKSGSLWLTIVLHAIVNASALLQTIYFVGKTA